MDPGQSLSERFQYSVRGLGVIVAEITPAKIGLTSLLQLMTDLPPAGAQGDLPVGVAGMILPAKNVSQG
jgi:hypothetical protein